MKSSLQGRTSTTRRVVFATVTGFHGLDLVGPFEVFTGANVYLDANTIDAPRYELTVARLTETELTSESGLTIGPSVPTGCVDGPTDTLVIPGGAGVHNYVDDTAIANELRRLAAQSKRVASVCTGAFLLAAAGLASRRRVTTHWSQVRRLADEYPDVIVDPDAIHTVDGNIWTSAGVTAGIDLALAMVETDLGTAVADSVARHMVMFLRRPGGQTQFAKGRWAPVVQSGGIAVVCDLIQADPSADLSVVALAQVAHMSHRNFGRVFHRETGEPPARYVERVRVETARRLLEHTKLSTDVVAKRCGFTTAETMRRVFHRRLSVAPSQYRSRFDQTA